MGEFLAEYAQIMQIKLHRNAEKSKQTVTGLKLIKLSLIKSLNDGPPNQIPGSYFACKKRKKERKKKPALSKMENKRSNDKWLYNVAKTVVPNLIVFLSLSLSLSSSYYICKSISHLKCKNSLEKKRKQCPEQLLDNL